MSLQTNGSISALPPRSQLLEYLSQLSSIFHCYQYSIDIIIIITVSRSIALYFQGMEKSGEITYWLFGSWTLVESSLWKQTSQNETIMLVQTLMLFFHNDNTAISMHFTSSLLHIVCLLYLASSFVFSLYQQDLCLTNIKNIFLL